MWEITQEPEKQLRSQATTFKRSSLRLKFHYIAKVLSGVEIRVLCCQFMGNSKAGSEKVLIREPEAGDYSKEPISCILTKVMI